jgi:hypothetical protein
MLIFLRSKKAQAAMEGTVALAAGSLIIGLSFYVWGWGNAQVPIRQMTFTATRVMAGQPARSVSESGASGGSKFIVWPTYFRAPLP